MVKRLIVSGLVGGLLVAPGAGAMAQQASRDGEGCSGFMCRVFGSKLEDAPTPAPMPLTGAAVPKTPARKVAKVSPPVTIAADGPEAARLKVLATTLPKTRVHVVPSRTAASADFVVKARVDGHRQHEKARLFTEELHVVAAGGVHTPSDLAGKVVSFGPEGSAAQAAGRKAFAALGVVVTEAPLDLDNALDGVATGDIAAAVVLAPQPDSRLVRLKGAGLHLVAWPVDAALPDGAAATTIPGAAYPGLAGAGDHIRAVGYGASLDATGKGATGPAAKAFLAALSQHAGTLAKRGFDLMQAGAEARGDHRLASNERR